MSGRATGWVFDHARAVGAARLVLLAMADSADHRGRVSISREDLSELARIDLRTVGRCLAWLQEAGEITVESRANGPGSPTCYRINMAQEGRHAPDNVRDTGQDAPVTHDLPEPTPDRAAPEWEPAGPPAAMPKGPLFPDDGAMAPGEDGRGGEKAPEEEPFAAPAGFVVWRSNVAPQNAPARPARVLPRHLPPGDLGQVLAALGVREGPRGLLYWWQREHKVELAALLDRLGLDVSELTARIEENHVSAPDLGRVADIEGLL